MLTSQRRQIAIARSKRFAPDTAFYQQLRNMLAGVVGARLHRVVRHADDAGDFGNGLLVIVDQVKDCSMCR